MSQTQFTKQVLSDIHAFLNQNTKVFANERDLQINMAVYLKSKQYDVEMEYNVSSDVILPCIEKKSIPWRVIYYPWFQANSVKPQEMYVDMVISNGHEYVPVELKYRKKQLKGDITLFGQNLGKGILLKNDSAQDLGRYGFWKDVCRLEFLKKEFGNISNGIAIFVTNDASYRTAPGAGTNSENFSMGNSSVTFHKNTNCCWPFNPMDTIPYKSCPNFNLENAHDVNWSDYTFGGVAFHCAEVVV